MDASLVAIARAYGAYLVLREILRKWPDGEDQAGAGYALIETETEAAHEEYRGRAIEYVEKLIKAIP